MASSNFVDQIRVFCRSGKGGSGSAHFRREKFVPKGDSDGGDGGRGGHVIMRGNAQMWTLLHLRYTKHLFAENGESGGKQQSTGANGGDIVFDVPLGTIARDGLTASIWPRSPKTDKRPSCLKVEEADLEMYILNRRPIRHHAMHSRVNPKQKPKSSSN